MLNHGDKQPRMARLEGSDLGLSAETRPRDTKRFITNVMGWNSRETECQAKVFHEKDNEMPSDDQLGIHCAYLTKIQCLKGA